MEESEALLFGAPVKAESPLQFSLDSAYQGEGRAAMVKQALKKGVLTPWPLWMSACRRGWDGIETTQSCGKWPLTSKLSSAPPIRIIPGTRCLTELAKATVLLLLKKPFDAAEALQLAHAPHREVEAAPAVPAKNGGVGSRVAQRTSELRKTNDALEVKVTNTPG